MAEKVTLADKLIVTALLGFIAGMPIIYVAVSLMLGEKP